VYTVSEAHLIPSFADVLGASQSPELELELELVLHLLALYLLVPQRRASPLLSMLPSRCGSCCMALHTPARCQPFTRRGSRRCVGPVVRVCAACVAAGHGVGWYG
jgi:hypothetical protein